jgi:hypothetical protein
VAVFGVTKNSGVSETLVDVTSGVCVAVLIPANVGVIVYVGVGIVGVALGISVGIFVNVREGVNVATGTKKNCSNVMEQDESKIAQIKITYIFFM